MTDCLDNVDLSTTVRDSALRPV